MNNIFLCGFMGAGKSKIGEVLADMMDYTFIDLDHQIEQEAGLTISRIFKERGEAQFRKMERRAVKNFLKGDNHIVALGGGALQDKKLAAEIKNKSLLIFIDCPMAVILKRLQGSKSRPLLLNADGSEKEPPKLERELTELYKKRLPLYNRAAIRVDSNKFSSPEETAVFLIQKIESYGR